MDRAEKEAAVASLNATFGEAGVVVVTRNLGLTVAKSTELRTKMRAEGASYKVTKNRLAKLAAQGTPYASIADLFTGPVALATSGDPVAAATLQAALQAADKLLAHAESWLRQHHPEWKLA